MSAKGENYTTVQLRKETREKLRRCKRAGETYDEVVLHLIGESEREPVGDEDNVAAA
jgi:hypothetical protein